MSFANKRTRAYRLTDRMEQVRSVENNLTNLRTVMAQIELIERFGAVAQEHFLSAPVVATMRATPGFIQAAKSFPDAGIFNIIPETRNSARQIMAVESLVDAAEQSGDALNETLTSVVDSTESLFASLEQTADDLVAQLRSDRAKLEAADLHDDVVAHLQVYTLSEERFGRLLGMMENYLENVAVFDVEHLKANPEKVSEEIDSLKDLVDDMGDALGLKLSDDGVIVAGDRHADFQPTEATFGEKGIDRATLIFMIDRAIDICGHIRKIGERKDEYITALKDNAADLPADMDGDDVTYGARDHLRLFDTYVTVTTNVIREAIVLTSRLLTTADSILEVADGEPEDTAAEED